MLTETDIELTDLVWSDGTVKVADSGFPIQINVGGTVIEEVKVFLCKLEQGGFVLAVWSKGSGSGPELILLDRVVSIADMGKRRRMTLEQAGPIEYLPSRHCGCGTRLKGFRPWADVARAVGVPRPSAPWAA